MENRIYCRDMSDKLINELQALSNALTNKVSFANLSTEGMEVADKEEYLANLLKGLDMISDILSDARRGKEV